MNENKKGGTKKPMSLQTLCQILTAVGLCLAAVGALTNKEAIPPIHMLSTKIKDASLNALFSAN